jgi:hypothetical protein
MDPRRRRGVPARGGPPDGRAVLALPPSRRPRSSPAAPPTARPSPGRRCPGVPCPGLCTCTSQVAVCTVNEINLIGAYRSLRSAGPKNRTPDARSVNCVPHSGADLRKVLFRRRTGPGIRPRHPPRGNSGYRSRRPMASGRHPISPHSAAAYLGRSTLCTPIEWVKSQDVPDVVAFRAVRPRPGDFFRDLTLTSGSSPPIPVPGDTRRRHPTRHCYPERRTITDLCHDYPVRRSVPRTRQRDVTIHFIIPGDTPELSPR